MAKMLEFSNNFMIPCCSLHFTFSSTCIGKASFAEYLRAFRVFPGSFELFSRSFSFAQSHHQFSLIVSCPASVTGPPLVMTLLVIVLRSPSLH